MNIFYDVFGQEATISHTAFFLCVVTAIFLGAVIANVFMYKSNSSKSYALTISLLPLTVCVVVMLVSDNFGAGLAIAGAFSLLKFKSEAGSGKEMIGIFLAVASGIGCGIGYVTLSICFVAVSLILYRIYSSCNFWNTKRDSQDRQLTISYDFSCKEDDLNEKVLELVSKHAKYVKTKSTVITPSKKKKSMVATYIIQVDSEDNEKKLIDELKYSDIPVQFDLSVPKTVGIKRM